MSKLIRPAIIKREPVRKPVITSIAGFVVAIAIFFASCLSVSAQQGQVEPVGDENANPKRAVAVKKPYDTMKIADDFVMPVSPGEDAERDELREYRAASRIVRDRIRDTEKEIKTALEDDGNLSGVTGGFSNFMQGYVYPRMTQKDNETLSTLGEIREDFFRDYLSDKVTGSARQQVISATVPVMQRIVDNDGGSKNYHEAVRLNAILILGLIDGQPVSRDAGSLPAPSAQAFGILVDVFTDSKYPAYLKVGALAGIQRQAEIDRLRSQPQLTGRLQITQEALRILQEPAKDDADYWLKRRSVQVLGYFGDVGSNGAILDEIMKIASDPNQPKWLRFDAISALGNLNYDATVGAKAKSIPTTVASYVAQSLDLESNELKAKLYELIEKNILFEDIDLEKIGNADLEKGKRGSRGSGIGAGGGGLAGDEPPPGMGGGGRPGSKNIDLGPRVELANYHLNDARRKVKVIAYTAKEVANQKSLQAFTEKEFVENFTTILDKLIKEADVGITNLDDEEPEIDPDDEEAVAEAKKTNTTKMYELYAKYAKRVGDLVPDAQGPAGGNSDDPLAEGAGNSN